MPMFCPGCSHEQSLKLLDGAFSLMGLQASQVVIVTDIGCSGFFDTFFKTHAMHGLHGRALTYAAGIKLACPNLKVVVVMGDGGVGIGGTHLLEACRRNLDLTLIILNNFNFGMTGGQFSATTPSEADVASGFLNSMEKPLDVCGIAASAGAPFLVRASAHQKNMTDLLVDALTFEGFSLLDIWGRCPGRYGRKNRMSAKDIDEAIHRLPSYSGPVQSNLRPEYGATYRDRARKQTSGFDRQGIVPFYESPVKQRREILFLGTAGGGVISAGSVLAQAAVSAGMHVTQRSEHNVTVMRGPSVTELIVSPKPIVFYGIEQPDIIVALSHEGVDKHVDFIKTMKKNGLIILAKGVKIPETACPIRKVDFEACGVKPKAQALASLAVLAGERDPVTYEMLENAVKQKFQGKRAREAITILEKTTAFLKDQGSAIA